MRTDLDQELVPPPIQRLETLARIHIVDQHATVRSSVKGHPERLETFLTGRVPQLHGHDSVVHHEFSGEEVGAWIETRWRSQMERMVHGRGRSAWRICRGDVDVRRANKINTALVLLYVDPFVCKQTDRW